MLRYAARRVALAALILCLAMVALFCMIYLIPGDPASIALGPRATAEIKDALRAKMGLDQPILLQLVRFGGNVLRGDLGIDVWTNRDVGQVVLESLPYTLALVLLGIGWAFLAAVPLGCYAAIHRDTWVDRVLGVLSISTIAIPPFVVALYSILIFAVALKWFPSIGAGRSGDIGSQLYHLVLPVFSLGLGWVGYLARLVRASMLEVLGQPYIRTARAYGIPRRKIIFHYALKVAILPSVAVLGVAVGFLLSGAVFAEIVFSRPGIGKLIYDAVITRNYPVVMGAVLVTTGLFTLATLISDLLSAWLDPRIRHAL